MQITIDLPDDIVAFAQRSAEGLEYESLDAFIAALLERQRTRLEAGVANARREGGTLWTPALHDELRQRLAASRKAAG